MVCGTLSGNLWLYCQTGWHHVPSIEEKQFRIHGTAILLVAHSLHVAGKSVFWMILDVEKFGISAVGQLGKKATEYLE